MRWVPTPSEAHPAVVRLTSELARLDAAPLAAADGVEITRTRADVVDATVAALFEPVSSPGVAVTAVGGYGRRELTAGSDIDLLVLHRPGVTEGELRAVLQAVLYPLWDAGLTASHTVRTVEQCWKSAEDRVENLTSVLDLRFLSGAEELVTEARSAIVALAAFDAEAFALRLEAWREDRGRRFGHAGRMLEPDLKESLGGLRDIALVGWWARTSGRPEARDWWELDRIRARFLVIREALHRVAGRRTTRLAADHHAAVAELLGVVSEPGWEGRDVLVREVITHARSVDVTATEVLQRRDVVVGIRTAHRGLAAPEATDVIGVIRRDGVSAIEGWLSPEPTSDPLPEWADVRGRPQRDPYHRYPVDVHLIETGLEVERLLRKPDDRFSAEAVALIDDPVALKLGALLHDIGKIGRGPHVPVSVDVAGQALDRMEVDGALRSDVLFLVGEHLLLSDTATRRNLEDEDLILRVAATIGSERLLAMLYLLTVADAVATGPSASTPWRLGLIRELVAKLQRVFQRGLMDIGRAERIAEAERLMRRAIGDVSGDQVDRFLQVVPPGYLLWVDPAEASAHLRLVVPRPGLGEIRTDLRPGRIPGTFRLVVGALDRVGLLASIAGALSLAGLSILSAQAFTTEDGQALDAFDVRAAHEGIVGPERWARFHDLVRGAIDGRLDLATRVRSVRSQYRPTPAGIPVRVRIDPQASAFSSVVEVEAADRVGLLFDLARTFAALGLDVHAAKVATYGPRVVDVFYVNDADGRIIEDPERLARVEERLREAALHG